MRKPRVAIVDYGVGNLFSVAQACAHVGLTPEITSDAEQLYTADAVILPGVGAFGFAMSRLQALGLVPALLETAESGKPLMGICLGFQLLFNASEEMGNSKGLGLVPGVVRPLANVIVDTGHKPRIPNIAWLPVAPRLDRQLDWASGLLADVKAGTKMYFVHSYFAEPAHQKAIQAETSYHGYTFCCATETENVFGCQFHPEKSAEAGLQIYNNLARKLQA
jgi:imidazole glycerol-phosphate synthase subunit HisH